jgi:hypothetical protein
MKLNENSSSRSHTDACRQTDGQSWRSEQALFTIYVNTPKKEVTCLRARRPRRSPNTQDFADNDKDDDDADDDT